MKELENIAHALVTQSEAVVYETRGYRFPKNRPVRVNKKEDILAFQTDGRFDVKLVPLARQKVADVVTPAPKSEPVKETSMPTQKVVEFENKSATALEGESAPAVSAPTPKMPFKLNKKPGTTSKKTGKKK